METLQLHSYLSDYYSHLWYYVWVQYLSSVSCVSVSPPSLEMDKSQVRWCMWGIILATLLNICCIIPTPTSLISHRWKHHTQDSTDVLHWKKRNKNFLQKQSQPHLSVCCLRVLLFQRMYIIRLNNRVTPIAVIATTRLVAVARIAIGGPSSEVDWGADMSGLLTTAGIVDVLPASDVAETGVGSTLVAAAVGPTVGCRVALHSTSR